MAHDSGRLVRADGVALAWQRQSGRQPTVVFLPGFNSHMGGEKASLLAAHCAATGQGFLRFDYAGHGASEGSLAEGTIGGWTNDALLVLDRLSEGPLLLVGSSMGGWIALLAALARPARIAGLLGIAAAPDFTEALMWQAMSFAEREALMRTGRLLLPSRYGEPYPISRALIEEGRNHLLLNGKPIALAAPVRLLHGQRDPDVPWEMALRLAELLASPDVQVTLIKDGDHRLSRPADLALLRRTLDAMLDGAGSTITPATPAAPPAAPH